ncbi:MAG: type I restriction enzyme HsdR N-terminal domain-containing protein [Desulfonauticus sp.]|nr:type I restriction enzyme HsdR N-terminal domain-containing protein [Desulfonauticus sp.]
MHETSLNQTIQDYLTGKEIELTSFEDIRQALAKMLVEEKGYPRENIKAKQKLSLSLENDKSFEILIDFIIYDPQKKPLMLLAFCPGEVASFVRQYIAVARLYDPFIPLVLVTDTKEAYLIQSADKKILQKGYYAIPTYSELADLAQKAPSFKLDAKKQKAETCLAHAYFALTAGCCNSGQCSK